LSSFDVFFGNFNGEMVLKGEKVNYFVAITLNSFKRGNEIGKPKKCG